MSMKNILSKYNFTIIFNISIILIYCISGNYLEEDLILGFCSFLIFFFIFFLLRELKGIILRQVRVKIKSTFRVQAKLLKRYYLIFTIFVKIKLIYFNNIIFKYINFKLNKFLINININLFNFYSKFIYIRLVYLNFLKILGFYFLKFFVNSLIKY